MGFIKIGNRKYKVKEAKTEQEKIKGLQNIEKLPKDEGMLFYFDPNEEISMWMKDTKIPLDIVFINDDQEVTKVHHGKPNDTTLISSPETAYVLEVNENSGIKIGDELDLEDDSDPVMKVLAPDGSTQMELWGGERIVSRRETKILIKKAKAAEAVKDTPQFENKCRSLGKYIFKVIKGQDTRPAEYVENKNS